MLFTDHLKELIDVIQWYSALYKGQKVLTKLVFNLMVLSIGTG